MANDIRRPNILFAVADDASHMSAYGHRFVHTPNFDRVAEAGILFLNAFTPNPKCAPSRACILTGRHTWQLEEACNHYGLFPAKFPVYPDLLERAGYVVGFTGKGWAPGDWKRGGRSRNPAGPAFNERTLTPPAGTRINRNDYAANFADFLAQRPADQPFCFWYGGFEPHRPYEPGEGLRAGKRPDTVDVPGFLPNVDVVREDLLDYANEIEWFDRHLGLMLDQLEAIGELDNTLVVVTSDNGMPFPRVKGNMYEPDFHLPMALCWPAATSGCRRVEDLVSFVDLAPTFLAAAGVEAPTELVGRSLLSIVE
ncbi:MAG TPA: sulfatase, partial [Limnochordia bacterium]|nr:sulfatase [Limnochordia bacterium]